MILQWVDIPQNMIPYDMIKWTVEKKTILNDSKYKNRFKDLIK